MDPALLKEREAFQKRAAINPVATNKVQSSGSDKSNANKDDLKRTKARPQINGNAPKDKGININNYKTLMSGSNYRFGVLMKIVKYMKMRYQDGDDHPLTFEEILDETNQLDIAQAVKTWLITEALVNNPKIEYLKDVDRYVYKPVYKIKDGKGLMRLLKQHDLKSLGGILMEDVQESIPNVERIVNNRAHEIIVLTRPVDKKKVLFYNDRSLTVQTDEEFQKLWRTVPVEALEDSKIDEYLSKQGIISMQDNKTVKSIPKRRKLPQRKRVLKAPRDNEHLADVLVNYEDNTLTQKGV